MQHVAIRIHQPLIKNYQFSIISINKMQPGKDPQSNQKPKVTFSYQNKNSVQNAIPLNQMQQVPAPMPMPMQSQMQMQMPVQNQIPDYAWQYDEILQVSNSNNMMNNNIQLQQFQVPSYGGYCGVVQGDMNQNIFYPASSGVSIELLSTDKQDKDKKVVAVIVSFVSNFSYDNLFTTVQQKSQEGTKVLVYSCTSEAVQPIFKAYKGEETENEKAKELIKNIRQVDSDCVVFNWECSAGYGSQTFPEGKEALFSFLKFVIDKGHMAMFSDFSLKSLIQQWDAIKLGPNPFKKVGQTSSPFELSFERQKLMQCPSAQLQIVGQMSQNGRCHVQAMGGTIVYSVNNKIKKTDFYQLSVLTIAETDCKYQQNDYKLELKQKKGSAGHVLLTYKSGGHLLTSMGHWIELMKVDTSEHKLFEIAEKQFGSSYAQQMKYQYAQMDVMQQKQFISQNAVRFVQNQAPCQNMMSKNAYMSKKG